MMKLEELSDGDEVVVADPYVSCLKSGQVVRLYGTGNLLFFDCEAGGTHCLDAQSVRFFSRFIQRKGGWIGVDLDGTMAVYDKWRGPEHIGAPIPAMIARVRKWLEEGRDVRIFTARVTEKDKNEDETTHDLEAVRRAIRAWSLNFIGRVLPITNVKDWNMMELWDDRAVQMVPNTGRTLAEEHEAVRSADEGKAATA